MHPRAQREQPRANPPKAVRDQPQHTPVLPLALGGVLRSWSRGPAGHEKVLVSRGRAWVISSSWKWVSEGVPAPGCGERAPSCAAAG